MEKMSNVKLSLFFLGVIMVVFGFFVLSVNVTLLYKGKSIIEKETVKEGSDAAEIIDTAVLPKRVSQVEPSQGDEIGKLIVPKLSMTIPIFHGTSTKELQAGVGHVMGTSLPGEDSNVVLTGHRDTVFRRLGDISTGDVLRVESNQGLFTYKVRKVRIVDEADETVIVPKRKPTLTVSTCYPFHYIGPAKQRYVLVADLIQSNVKREEKTAESLSFLLVNSIQLYSQMY